MRESLNGGRWGRAGRAVRGWLGAVAFLGPNVAAAVAPAVAHAQEINVAIDPALAQAAGLDAAAIERQIHDAAEGQLKLDAPKDFLNQMAAANAWATKGMGVDYASNPQRFVVGGSFGTAVNGVGFEFIRGQDTLPTGGFALQVTGMAGLNLGIAASDDSFLRRVVVYANGMYFKGAAGPFDAEFYNLGGHVQIKLIRPPHKGVVEWGGLDASAGYELSSYNLLLSQSLPIAVEGLRWDATGSFNVKALSHTVPIELSTNLRVFVVSAYAGLGLDLRRGVTASGEMALEGPVYAAFGQQETKVGTVSASLGTEGSAVGYAPRGFVGAQINVLLVKVYGQLNVGLDDTYGGQIGVRVAL